MARRRDRWRWRLADKEGQALIQSSTTFDSADATRAAIRAFIRRFRQVDTEVKLAA